MVSWTIPEKTAVARQASRNCGLKLSCLMIGPMGRPRMAEPLSNRPLPQAGARMGSRAAWRFSVDSDGSTRSPLPFCSISLNLCATADSRINQVVRQGNRVVPGCLGRAVEAWFWPIGLPFDRFSESPRARQSRHNQWFRSFFRVFFFPSSFFLTG